MINKPSDYVKNIGNSFIRTTMLFAILSMNTSFSSAKFSPDTNKWGVETIDLKAFYKANITKCILEAKTFPIQITYTHEKELKAAWFILRNKISFDETIKSFVLTDDTGKKRNLHFLVKVPFAYGSATIVKVDIKSFGFDIENNKFNMIWTFWIKINEKTSLPIHNKEVGLQKMAMLNSVIPGALAETQYEVEIWLNNDAWDKAKATVTSWYVPTKDKWTIKKKTR